MENDQKVYVVDPKPTDYEGILDPDAVYTFFSSADEALRNVNNQPSMWIINMRLPDMPGTRLNELLRDRGNFAPVTLVDDNYAVADEIAARCSGVAMFLTKPLRGEWLQVQDDE